jgi:hypothetical protein
MPIEQPETTQNKQFAGLPPVSDMLVVSFGDRLRTDKSLRQTCFIK